MLPKKFRLSPNDFQRIYERGRKAKGEFGMLIALNDASMETAKMGIVVNSKVGNAVQRHSLTRKIREISRPILKTVTTPTLFQYVAFKYTDDQQSLKRELTSQFLTLVGAQA